ncbi:MAG: hypothetical protein P8189_15360 [Anaerolineae bacterium]|jgi:hypothetical protein
MTKEKKAVLLAVALLACLLVAGVAQAYRASAADWWVIGGGGGHVATAPYTLDGTVGQAVVGTVSQVPYDLCTGFWCGAEGTYRIYLPLVLRQQR